MFCQKCGKEIADDAAFCDECGTQMGASTHNNSLKGINEKLKAGIDSAKSLASEKAKNIHINENHKEKFESAKNFASENLKKLPINEKFKTPKILSLSIITVIFLLILVGFFNSTPSLEKVLDNRQGEEAIAQIQDAIAKSGVNASDYENTTVMMIASIYGYADVVEALINEGADYNAEDDNYQSALSYASRNGHIDTVKVLLKQKKINIDAINGRALRAASYNGWYDVVELLINKGADVNAETDGGETALQNSFQKNYPEIALLLIENDAAIFDLMSTAIQRDWFDVVDLCIKKLKELDISKKQETLDSALVTAIQKEYLEIAENLLEEGANINGTNYIHETPLYVAVGKANLAIVNFLIEAGADTNAVNMHGVTPLHVAVRNDNSEITKLLIEAGADVNIDHYGDTPLHDAIGKKNTETVKLLIDAGADVNAVDGDDKTPLYHALDYSEDGMAKLLIDAGVDVSTVSLSDWPYNRTTDEIKQMLRAAGAKE